MSSPLGIPTIPADVFGEGELVNAVKLFQRIYSIINDLITNTVADSGWVTDGYTVTHGNTINAFAIRRVGPVVGMAFAGVFGFARAGTADGNYANAQMLTVPDEFVPSTQPISQGGIGPGEGGPNFSYAIQQSGMVVLTSGPPNHAVAIGDAFSCSGVYLA